jgi:hypothetical protein
LTRYRDAVTCRFLLVERVAQMVEHLTFNQEVPGSNPGALTSVTNDLNAISNGTHTKIWRGVAPRVTRT